MGKRKSRAWSCCKYRYNRYVYAEKTNHTHNDSGICDDVEKYLFRHDTSLSSLVTMLTNDHFYHRRYSDTGEPL